MIALLEQPFYFLRHGETPANVADLISGATDDPLTENGLAQAEAAAEILSSHPIAAIWHSPLTRARLTAEAVARRSGAPLIALPGLAERNWGVWEGGPRSQLIRDAKPEGGEGPDEFATRIRTALAAITGPFPVLIVGHSGTAREIHAYLSEAPFTRPGNARPILWHRDAARHWTGTELSPAR